MSKLGWGTDKKGHLYKEVEVKAKPGTAAYSKEMFAELGKMADEMDAVGFENFVGDEGEEDDD